MNGDGYSRDELSAMVDQLQDQVSRHVHTQLNLVKMRDRLDAEVARFKTMQTFSSRAMRASSLETLSAVSVEAVVEVFDFNRAALFLVDAAHQHMQPAGVFGLRDVPISLPVDVAWLQGDARVLRANDPLLAATGLGAAVLCAFFNQQGTPIGLVLGGISRDKMAWYPPIGAEICSPFGLITQQIGGLWANHQLRLRVQEQRSSVLFQRSNDAIFLAERSGAIVDCNPRASEIFATSHDDLAKLKLFELSCHTATARLTAGFDDLQNQGSVRLQLPLCRGNGDRFPAEVSLSLFVLDQRSMVHCVVRDVTDREKSQELLIKSERLAALGQLVAGIAHEINTPIGVVRSGSGNVMRSLDGILAHLPDLFKSLPDELLEPFLSLIVQARERSSVLSSREERAARRTIAKVLSENGITDARRIADQFVDMGITEDVERFLLLLRAEIPHLMSCAYDLAAMRRNNDNVRLAADRASKVVFALRKFAHQEPDAQLEETDLADTVETVLTLYQNQLKQGVEVVRRFEDMALVPCRGDDLGQVWTNLVHNAIQAMAGKGRLEIEVRREGDQALVRFIDSGPGIAADVIDKIFEPFFTTKAAGEGSGLGLDISNRIIHSHGGRIEVKSRPGRTAFTVRIPAARVADV